MRILNTIINKAGWILIHIFAVLIVLFCIFLFVLIILF